MASAERVQAVADYGFTEREARFLVLVMRHAGLCVKRQYAAFAGIANGGERCNALFDKLTRRGFAVAVDCIHNRARPSTCTTSRSITPSARPTVATAARWPPVPPPSG